ncbi:MAG: glycosyltransferase family 4 protein [Deltaproteobacteria bacterium]|nr:glycosyltransferase family 4 protein [Deltaproteobacteria bacterium]
MKIALVIKDYSLKKGGLERYVVNLSKELEKMGHDVHVFANFRDTPEYSGITFHHVPIIKFSFILKNFSFAVNSRHLLEDKDFDIINGFSRIYPLDVYRIGHKVRRHLLNVQYPNKFKKFLKCFSIKHLTILYLEEQVFKQKNHKKIIANSELGKKHAIYYHAVPKNNIEVIYNGVDLNKFNPTVRSLYRDETRKKFGIKKNEIVLLFVGRNFKLKGVKTIIESISLLWEKKEKIRVLIAGKGNPSSFLKLAKKLNVENKIFFAGESNKIEKFYAAGDIFVFPTLYDPFANVCLEAMACGLPVITTKMNGASEIIKNGRNGYVVEDYTSPGELAARITDLLPKDLRENMNACAFETAKQYTPSNNAARVEKLYENILKNK